MCAAALAVAAIPLLATATPRAPRSETAHAELAAIDFVAPPAISDPILSPDGRRVAARAMVDGVPRLALYEAGKSAPRPQSVALPEGEQLEWFQWTSDGNLLVSLLRDGLKPLRRLAALDLASGALRPIGPARRAGVNDAILHVDPAGTYLLLQTRSPRQGAAVHRIDLATGADTLVVAAQPGVREWVVDSAGVVRAGMGRRDGNSWLVYRKREGDRFSRSQDAEAQQDPDADTPQQLVPVHGRDLGYALASTPQGRVGVYAYDFRRGRLGALVHADPDVDLDGFATDAAGHLIGVQRGGERDETTWLDSKLAARQARIDRALPGRANRIVSATADEKRLLVLSSAPEDPGAYYLYADGRATLVARVNPAVSAARSGVTQEIVYPARDGLRIAAYLTLPAGRDAKGLPLIVMPHGGPYARDSWGYDPWVQYLAARGYAVLRPNYRGSTGFGEAMVAAGDGQWGRGMQEDVADGVAWAVTRGLADPGRVCIMGASYGGYAAMWAAVKESQLYRCAISYAGISDVKAQLDFDRKTFEPGDFKAWRARIQGAAPSLESLSPMHFVDQLHMPLLIAHGTEDSVVPPDQSERLHAALVKRGVAHDYVAYPGEGHNLSDPASEADFLSRVGAFLAAHNPA